MTANDVKTAASWLKTRKQLIKLDPAALAKAAGSDNLQDSLYNSFVDDSLARDGGARDVVRVALKAAYDVCRKHPDYDKVFTQEVLIGLAKNGEVVIERLDSIKKDTTAILDVQVQILAALQARQPDDFAKHRDLIIGMASSYTKNPDGTPIRDIDAALRNIESALVEYVRMQAANELPRNAADHLDAVLARVNALNQRGEIPPAFRHRLRYLYGSARLVRNLGGQE